MKSMSKMFLDLRSLYNHRMVYPDDRKTDEENPIGIVNNFIKESSFVFDKEIVKDSDSCLFRRGDSNLDNSLDLMAVITVGYEKGKHNQSLKNSLMTA